MRFTGILCDWNDERGFGFIVPDRGGDRIFVHAKGCRPGMPRPQSGQRCSFEVQVNAQGKKRAHNVELIRKAVSRPRPGRPDGPAKWGGASYFAIPLFLCIFLAAAMRWHVPRWELAWYVIASLITYLVYRHDKQAAAAHAWRTPESTLLLLGLCGGWPGAIVAQQRLRHKSVKQSFRCAFWTTVVVNVALFLYLNWPHGLRAGW